MSMKNGVFFLIDSLRYDIISNFELNKNLFPNFYKIYKKSSLYHCVSNSRSTQFVLPSLFSLSYPLDYGGYDTGIRRRPLSFVELLINAVEIINAIINRILTKCFIVYYLFFRDLSKI